MKAPFTAVAVLAAGLLASAPADAADILVTVTTQRVSGGPGCSLQEAIFSANLDASLSVVGIDAFGNMILVPTNCVPGSGADRIILPFRATFTINGPIVDPANALGPTATPVIRTTVVVEGNGASLVWSEGAATRAFSVDVAGHLTMSSLHIADFTVRGGDGASAAVLGGGGGGMGAGGAVFVRGGTLIARKSALTGNTVTGGQGGFGMWGGGGGGMGGNGGEASSDSGGGGGGAYGTGRPGEADIGGDGGGTGPGRLLCGAVGGGRYEQGIDPPQDALCDGGGGGGGGAVISPADASFAGRGAYGGGGGGGGRGASDEGGSGGDGGFGGGGGASGVGSRRPGGAGGFGGGGGGSEWRGGSAGMFGGYGSETGGGGAGLGGAIFSDGGTVVLENCTFYRNTAQGGDTPFYEGGKGEGRGGAIFSFGGRLTLRNVTIAYNHAATADGGLVMYAQVPLPRHTFTSTAELAIFNSIISNNRLLFESGDTPQCRAVGLTPSGAGNLIHDNDNCAGVVRTGSPWLGYLLLNAPGNTPTLAIGNESEAFNTADPATSLPYDQRGMPRPKQGAFDIGAYERCVSRPEVGVTCALPIFELPDTVMLTTFASPSTGGTVSPLTGAVPQNSVQPLVATPAAGWQFSGWTGDPVGDPTSASTFIGMDTAHDVTGTFVTWTARFSGRATPGSATAVPRVDLTWLAPGGVHHYDVSRASVSGGPYAVVGSATTAAFSDRTAGLTNGSTYYYRVEAVAADGAVFGRSSEAVVRIPVGR